MSKWGSEIRLFGWYLIRPRNLVLVVRVFAYWLAVRVVLDFQAYWRSWEESPYVEIDAAYLRDTALVALIAGAVGAFVCLRKDRLAD